MSETQSSPPPTGTERTETPLPSRRGFLTFLFVVAVLAGLATVALLRNPAVDDSAPLAPSIEDLPAGALAGQAAPDLQLTLFDGTPFSLAEHFARDGRPVMLNFWASWCAPCRAEMPEFDALSRAKPELLVLGVAVQDTEAEARAFAESLSISYPLAHDPDGEAESAYPFLGLPTTWLIHGDGVIVRQIQGIVNGEFLEQLLFEDLGI